MRTKLLFLQFKPYALSALPNVSNHINKQFIKTSSSLTINPDLALVPYNTEKKLTTISWIKATQLSIIGYTVTSTLRGLISYTTKNLDLIITPSLFSLPGQKHITSALFFYRNNSYKSLKHTKEGLNSNNGFKLNTYKIEIEVGIKDKNHLDILARLLTSLYGSRKKSDVCVSVCLHDNKLFIASNRKKPEYAKECLENLQELIKNHSVKSYENLLKKAAEKIRHIELKSKSKGVLKEFKEKAKECSKSKSPDWSNLQALAKKLFKEIKETSKENSIINHKWKFLMPWHEVGEVVRLIIEQKFEGFLKSSIEHCENRVVYVEDEGSPNSEIPIHSEMKIVDKLYMKKKKQTQEIRYIGSTKKACIHCQAIIEIFNEDGKYFWVTYGTHGGNRISCRNPSIVAKYNKGQEVEKRIELIKTIGLIPGNSSTSEVPKTLTNPVQLLDKLRIERK